MISFGNRVGKALVYLSRPLVPKNIFTERNFLGPETGYDSRSI